MKKDDIKAKLDDAGIEYDESATKDELEALLPEDAGESKDGFVVGEPQEIRPQELPLVVKPKGGKWDNDAQAEYARTLNAYAYRNKDKWEEKKPTLLKRLREIGNKPKALQTYNGNKEKGVNLSYKNKVIEN